MADISNFANHFTSEMVSNLRPNSLATHSTCLPKDGEADTCDEFSDFSYVAPVSKDLLNRHAKKSPTSLTKETY